MSHSKREWWIQCECHSPGCNNLQVVTNYNYNDTGKTHYRKWCLGCHNTRTASKHGLKNIGQVVAKNAGFDSLADYLNSTHPYRQFRKTYCENEDGSITGWPCNTQKTLFKLYPKLLQVDHIDGNPYNNDEENLQTLCTNCHVVKGEIYGDCQTPGRKKLAKSLIN